MESDKFLIIELFARRQRHYDMDDVARLTGSTAEEIDAAMEAGNLEPQQHRGTPLFQWEEVATFALRRWTPRMIADALGSAHADALPPLNHMATLEVRLPLYQVELLKFLARHPPLLPCSVRDHASKVPGEGGGIAVTPAPRLRMLYGQAK